MDTTKANIILIASELSGLADALFTMVIADVSRQISNAAYGENEEMAQRYLAAHYLTLINDASLVGSGSIAGALTGMATGDVSNDFGNTGLGNLKDFSRYDTTSYGRVYMSIQKRCIHRARVYTPQ